MIHHDHGQESTGQSRRASQRSIMKSYNKSQLQLVKVFGAIFAVSMLTIIPFVIFGISILVLGNERSVIKTILQPISYISMLSRSVIHPLLEAYMNYETRDVISNFCSACVRRCKSCLTRCKKIHNEDVSPSTGAESGGVTKSYVHHGESPSQTINIPNPVYDQPCDD